MARARRLARDYERLSTTLAGLHFVAFGCLMLSRMPAITSPATAEHTLEFTEIEECHCPR
jgi:hypothetical protein